MTLYKGVVETTPKSMWHSHDFNGRSETNQDRTSHNATGAVVESDAGLFIYGKIKRLEGGVCCELDVPGSDVDHV